MPFTIELRDNSGNLLGIAGESPPRKFLPEMAGDDFPLLRGVDEYDDTCFNSLQMTWLLPELRYLRDAQQAHDQIRLLDEIIDLAEKCAAMQHTYLVFSGD